jgi:hypothetical protein
VPRKGTWAEISGDDLLKKLLCMVRARVLPARATRLTLHRLFALRRQEMQSIDNPYTGDRLTIDPRNLAQRILEARVCCTALPSAAVDIRVSWRERSLRRIRAQIRVHLAKEFVEDLKFVKARPQPRARCFEAALRSSPALPFRRGAG